MYLAGHPREEISSLLGWSEAKLGTAVPWTGRFTWLLDGAGYRMGGGKVTEKELQDLYGQALRLPGSDLRDVFPLRICSLWCAVRAPRRCACKRSIMS